MLALSRTPKRKRGELMGEAAKNVGAVFKKLRLARDWTQDQVSVMTGLSGSYIARVERGQCWPSEGALLKMCEAYDLRLHQLFALADGVVDAEPKQRKIPLPEAAKVVEAAIRDGILTIKIKS